MLMNHQSWVMTHPLYSPTLTKDIIIYRHQLQLARSEKKGEPAKPELLTTNGRQP